MPRIHSLEIRRVPLDWEHPRDEYGQYIPLHDKDRVTALQDWQNEAADWERGIHPAQRRYEDTRNYSFTEWSGPPPEPMFYRERRWTEADAAGYQVYETITEGTPVSPVFSDEQTVLAWLLAEGYRPADATRLIAVHILVPEIASFTNLDEVV